MANYGEEVVTATLEELGIDIKYKGDGWTWTLCPLHEDQKPSFAILLSEGAWKCSAGCGSSPDLAVLVQKLHGGELRAIQQKLRSKFIDDAGILERALLPPKKLEEEKFHEPLFYERDKMYPYLYERGFSKAILKQFNAGVDTQYYDAESNLVRCVVFPITEDGKLVGLYRRAIKGKGFFNSAGYDKDSTLFGLDHIPDEIDYVVVVEGALDCVWLHQHGYYAVATLGGSLSFTQAKRLVKRFKKVILAFDMDKQGRGFEDEAVAYLKNKVMLTKIKLPKPKKDVQECNEEELLVAFSNANMV